MRGLFPSGLAVLLGVAAAGGAALAQDAAGRPLSPSITVEGRASREVAPDMAVVTLGITAERPTASDAAAETGRVAKAVDDEVAASGIAPADVRTAEATMEPVYDNGNAPKLRAFRATNIIQIRVRKLDTMGDLVGRLLSKGANTLQSIDYTVADPKPVLDELRAEATRDARHRADIYAQTAGVSLGRVLRILPGGTAPTTTYMPRLKAASIMAAPAPVPLQAGTQSLDADVTITWELGP